MNPQDPKPGGGAPTHQRDVKIMAQFVAEKDWTALQVDGDPLGDDWLITVSLTRDRNK